MNDTLDTRFREMLAEAREAEPTPAAVAAVTTAVRRRTPPRRTASWIRRPLAVAVGGTLLVASAAGAGALVVLDRDQAPGHTEPKLAGPSYVAATGSSGEFGDWRLVFTRSDQGNCIGMQFPGQASATASAPLAESCGGQGPALFIDAKATLAFGIVPEGTRSVDVSGPAQREPVSAELYDGPQQAGHDFYVAELPGRVESATATVR